MDLASNCRSANTALTVFRSQQYKMDSHYAVFAAFKSLDFAKKQKYVCGESGEMCGAIQAAISIAPDLEDIIFQEFKLRSSSVQCEDLLRTSSLSCAQCVRLACYVLEDYGTRPVEFKVSAWYEGMNEGELRALFANQLAEAGK